MGPNDADGKANNVDPDQTAPLGAVWSGSALFAQAYLSKNLGTLWQWKLTIQLYFFYFKNRCMKHKKRLFIILTPPISSPLFQILFQTENIIVSSFSNKTF